MRPGGSARGSGRATPRRACAALAACAALLALAAPASAAPLDVDVTGIEGDLRDNVLAGLTIEQRRKGRLTDPEIRELHARAPEEIERALEPFGYYRPLVDATLERERSRWQAVYRVTPGPPLLVDSTDVRVVGPGAGEPAFQERLREFPLVRGDPVIHSEYEEAKDGFVKAALKQGYLDARFTRHEIRVDLERYRAVIVLHVQTGSMYRFGPTEFRQDVVHPDLLGGYVNYRRGAPLDFNRLLEMEQALGNSPYFSRVEVRPRRDLAIGNEIPIVVDLRPARAEKYTVGAGYGTDVGPHVQAAAELRRLNRRGHRGEVEGTLSAIEQSGAVTYHVPWPYPRSDVLTLTAGYARIEANDTRERTVLAGPSWSRLWAGWQQTVALLYRFENFDVGLDAGEAGFLTPEAAWSRYRSNDPIDPSSGRRLRYRASLASEDVLSDASFFRLESEGKWIRTFRERHRLIGRAEGGIVWTDRFRRLPPSARFFAGGAGSVRGFGFRQLGARDEAGNVIGGSRLLAGSLEYELRVRERWGVAAFYDAGGAPLHFRGPWEQGAGLGVRWVSPIGLVRADLGVPLTEDRFRVEFHLSVGPAL